MRFAIPHAEWTLRLNDDALETFRSRVQRRHHGVESVGQLYAPSFATSEIEIRTATILLPRAASRTRVVIDKPQAERERAAMFENGMHCAGVWHTHPERWPSPSVDDNRLAEDYAQAAASVGLAGVIFVIVGTDSFPGGLFVGVHDGNSMHRAAMIQS
jgi:proteasome lid subunit RPN8/RPN11